MVDVGRQLREARLRAGLSREHIAAATKITVAKLAALEAGDVEHLPDGIYLDGIVRAYAAEVGLDGNALVAELRSVTSPSASGTVIVPPTPPLSAGSTDLDLFPEESSLAEPSSFPAESATSLPPPSQSRGAARFIVPVLALAAAVGAGAYLHHVTRPSATHEQIARPAVTDTPRAPVRAPDDGQAVSSANHHQEQEAASPEHAVKTVPPPVTPSPAPRAAEAAASAANDGRRPRDEARALLSESAKPAGPELSGIWTMDTRVESSSYRNFAGLQLGYRLQLHQEGNRITGQGVKVLENGRELADGARTPIHVEGTYDGQRVTLTFTERGTRRTTGGKMILDVNEDAVLRGRFSSSAARSSGTAEARRVEG